jgi:hypothetical protein
MRSRSRAVFRIVRKRPRFTLLLQQPQASCRYWNCGNIGLYMHRAEIIPSRHADAGHGACMPFVRPTNQSSNKPSGCLLERTARWYDIVGCLPDILKRKHSATITKLDSVATLRCQTSGVRLARFGVRPGMSRAVRFSHELPHRVVRFPRRIIEGLAFLVGTRTFRCDIRKEL